MREIEPLRPERGDERGDERAQERGREPGSPAPGAGWSEQAMVLQGSQGPMVGILARPRSEFRTAVLIVAGQPQTRVGAHRMFTDLARRLAERGVASLRFDIGGWGDSPGEPLAFERSGGDITLAASALRAACPASSRLWLWGLCDGASAAILALPALRAAGIHPAALCLVNPWVRSEASLADAMVRTYYLKRLVQGEFWSRLLSGRIPIENLLREPLRHLKARFGAARTSGEARSAEPSVGSSAPTDLPSQLLRCLSEYRGDVYTVLSGNDLTAAETDALMARDKRWRKRLDRRAALLRVPNADHTFSNPDHWAHVSDWIAERARP